MLSKAGQVKISLPAGIAFTMALNKYNFTFFGTQQTVQGIGEILFREFGQIFLPPLIGNDYFTIHRDFQGTDFFRIGIGIDERQRKVWFEALITTHQFAHGLFDTAVIGIGDNFNR